MQVIFYPSNPADDNVVRAGVAVVFDDEGNVAELHSGSVYKGQEVIGFFANDFEHDVEGEDKEAADVAIEGLKQYLHLEYGVEFETNEVREEMGDE